MIYTDLAFMEGIKSPCEVCEGHRFTADVLELKLRGKSISDVFAMTTEAALDFFPERKIKTVVQALNDVGLGYLQLGQPLDTLSGGECQRLKLATELHKQSSIYVMDEPTTGLHMSDVGHLLHLIDRLVDQGNSVIVIEHDLDVIKNADWIIDLGPDAGSLRVAKWSSRGRQNSCWGRKGRSQRRMCGGMLMHRSPFQHQLETERGKGKGEGPLQPPDHAGRIEHMGAYAAGQETIERRDEQREPP
ncbi:MAG: ATP-binding cassette domain-containing protein [Caldilineaceae bacterium]